VAEPELQRDIRLALSRERDLVIWRNNVGVAQHGQHRVRYGLALGSSDLIGILSPGRFIALEVKSPRGRATEEQQLFAELVRARGGFAATVRSVEEALAAVARARGGGSE